MSALYRFTVDAAGDEMDVKVDVDALQEAIGAAIVAELLRQTGAVELAAVNGRPWDFAIGKLAESPITLEIQELILGGRLIQAIKLLRAADPELSLGGAKRLAEEWQNGHTARVDNTAITGY